MKKISALFALVLMVSAYAGFTAISQAAPPERTTILDTVVVEDREFDILQAAVLYTELDTALDGNRQLTVFAPTDAAFIALGESLSQAGGLTEEEVVNYLVDNFSKEELTNILLYHVIPGDRDSASVLDAPQYKTLSGEKLTQAELDLNLDMIDLEVDNGRIHVINSVLLPPM